MSALTPARDIDAARRRAERIRIKARNVTEQYADLRALVDEAERNEDHLTLGYSSWTAYVSDLFGEEPLRLPRDERIPMVQMLADKGMSTRAIASVVGVHHDTVASDIKAGVGNPSPEVESLDEYRGRVLRDAEINQRIVKLTGPESVSDPTMTPTPAISQGEPVSRDAGVGPTKVVGLDGKTYTRPEPKPQADRRPPLRDGFRDAALDLDKLVHRFERLAADDRLPRNRSEVARYANDLTRATDALQRVAEQLSN